MAKKNQDELLKEMMKRPIPKKKVSIVHLQMVREKRTLYGMKRFTTPSDAVEVVRPLLDMADREMVLVLSLNNRLQPQAVEIAAVGGINHCNVDIPNLFKHALLNNALSIVCFHNHPSGDPEPSREDKMLTRKIMEAGNILGISLIDHIIVGEYEFFSFREHNLLNGEPNQCA
ncbi:MAG: JAB domain-containing protein [Hungatella sp.]|nr:JAB domain-containing protein [Hungatella sp.]